MQLNQKPSIPQQDSVLSGLRILLIVIGSLVLFVFSLDLMVSSFQNLGKNILEPILLATANPLNGLFIGLMVTAMVQSSSATTSLIVALVASGSLTIQGAVPIIMGANIGTTITSTIVALGFINRVKEFKRAVSAGIYHDIFNILTVVVLFPLEYYFGFLSNLAVTISNWLFPAVSTGTGPLGRFTFTLFDPILRIALDFFPAWLMTIIGVIALFLSIFLFRKIISDLLEARSPERFSRFFFRHNFKSFSWGLLTTAAIRSSTITTSVVVPLVAKRIVTLQQAAPFIMGANVGTTITALIAAMLNNGSNSAISIALVHILFNIIGVLLFFPIPFMRRIPFLLASRFGKLTVKYRLAVFVYLLTTFFFVPFTIIYFNQDSSRFYYLTYYRKEGTVETAYRIKARLNEQSRKGDWAIYRGETEDPNEIADKLVPISIQTNRLFIGDQMVIYGNPGQCWDATDDQGDYHACVESINSTFKIAGHSFDSVYNYVVTYSDLASVKHLYQFSKSERIMIRHEVLSDGNRIKLDSLTTFSIE